MQCPQCQQENREGAKFCEECGTRFVHTCPNCGHEVRPQAKFCDACGTSLTAPTLVPRPAQSATPAAIQADQPPPEPPTPDAERRQLTVMFCDLVGSTTLSGQLDPEDYRDMVWSYQAICSEVIQRYDGHVAQLLGDGLLVYFGYPVAHEDDAQRAVRTGLGMLDAMRMLNTRLERDKGMRLAIRVGIHTGLVVVGEMGGGGHQEQLAMGETPNIASRIQGMAEPDTVVISEAAYRLVEGYFACQALAPQSLKGVAQATAVYQTLQETGAYTRFEVLAAQGLTPLVGRKAYCTKGTTNTGQGAVAITALQMRPVINRLLPAK